jgi:hypothetical protein
MSGIILITMLDSVRFFWGQFFASFQPEKYDFNNHKEIW